MKMLECFDPVIALLRIIQKKKKKVIYSLPMLFLILKTGRKKPLNIQQRGLNSGHLLAA